MEASQAASIVRAVSIILVIIIIIIIITVHFSSQVIRRLALSLPKSQSLVIIKLKFKKPKMVTIINNGSLIIIIIEELLDIYHN